MKLMFLILAHKNAEQCAQLINCLLTLNDSSVTLHVDLKANEVYKNLVELFSVEPRVKFVKERYKVYWGSYEQILATSQLIKSAKNSGFDYYCLLSGQDFPIKPLKDLKNFLERNKGKEFLENKKLPSPDWEGEGGLNRVNLYWPLLKYKSLYWQNKLHGLIYHLQKKSGFRRSVSYNYYGGSNWFTLSEGAINLVADFLEKDKNYLNSYRYTRCADELFVQTILLNSELSQNVISDNLRYVDWGTGPEFPRTLRMVDLETLKNANGKFFARKLDAGVDALIISELNKYCGYSPNKI